VIRARDAALPPVANRAVRVGSAVETAAASFHTDVIKHSAHPIARAVAVNAAMSAGAWCGRDPRRVSEVKTRPRRLRGPSRLRRGRVSRSLPSYLTPNRRPNDASHEIASYRCHIAACARSVRLAPGERSVVAPTVSAPDGDCTKLIERIAATERISFAVSLPVHNGCACIRMNST